MIAAAAMRSRRLPEAALRGPLGGPSSPPPPRRPRRPRPRGCDSVSGSSSKSMSSKKDSVIGLPNVPVPTHQAVGTPRAR